MKFSFKPIIEFQISYVEGFWQGVHSLVQKIVKKVPTNLKNNAKHSQQSLIFLTSHIIWLNSIVTISQGFAYEQPTKEATP